MNINEQFELQQKLIDELKAQVNLFRVTIFNVLPCVNLTTDKVLRGLMSTMPEQCLNSVKADAIENYNTYLVDTNQIDESSMHIYLENKE